MGVYIRVGGMSVGIRIGTGTSMSIGIGTDMCMSIGMALLQVVLLVRLYCLV